MAGVTLDSQAMEPIAGLRAGSASNLQMMPDRIGTGTSTTSMAWLSRVSTETGYWSGIFGPMLLIGLGVGLVLVPLTAASLAGVPAEDSGVASGLVNMVQPVGGALGLGVLVAVYGTAARQAASHPVAGLTLAAQAQHVITHGIAAGFAVAAILDVCSLLVVIAFIKSRRSAPAPAAARAREGAVAEAPG